MNIVEGRLILMPIEDASLRRKIASFAASESSIYSDSMDERAVTDCFLLPHTIAPKNRKKMRPECDLRSSGSAACDASVKPKGKDICASSGAE